MSMQRRIYDASASWDQKYNDTIVDYGLQIEAYWQRLRERVGARMGNKVASNVVYVDFSAQDTAPTEIPATLEVGQIN